MIRFIGKLPRKCTIALSGGVDSVAITDFLLQGDRDVKLAFFHHGTPTSDAAEEFVKGFATSRGLELTIGRIDVPEVPRGRSKEEYWREARYKFLDRFDGPIVVCHHLDDAVETWIFSSLHGAGKMIPYRRGKVVRPFLLTPKSELVAWASRRGLMWMEDPTNRDERYPRNLIRHTIVPAALRVNPGLRKALKKKYIDMPDDCV